MSRDIESSRRRLATVCCLTVVTLSMMGRDTAVAETRQEALETFLTRQLLVQTPGDIAFVDKVLEAVTVGRIPETVVRGTCEWAVQKANQTGARYPFPYFRSAMNLKAKRLGVRF